MVEQLGDLLALSIPLVFMVLIQDVTLKFPSSEQLNIFII